MFCIMGEDVLSEESLPLSLCNTEPKESQGKGLSDSVHPVFLSREKAVCGAGRELHLCECGSVASTQKTLSFVLPVIVVLK